LQPSFFDKENKFLPEMKELIPFEEIEELLIGKNTSINQVKGSKAIYLKMVLSYC